MLAIFKTIEVQNFLSVGNVPLKIKLDHSAKTLIYGSNGVGKSILLDALMFALYGKSYRNVNKPQLVNTYNKKNCVVTLDVNVDSKEYKLVRGIEPSLFEIWVDGQKKEKTGASTDMQEWWENSVFRLNPTTFKQICLLGSADYTPFMRLNAQQRREVSEQLSSTAIISVMTGILKDNIKETLNILSQFETRKGALNVAYDRMLDIQAGVEEKYRKELECVVSQATECVTRKSSLQEEIGKLGWVASEVRENSRKRDDIISKVSAKQSEIEGKEKTLRFFRENNTCSTCLQPITEKHRRETTERISSERKTILKDLEVVLNEKVSINQKMKSLAESEKTVQGLNSDLAKAQGMLRNMKEQVEELKRKIKESESKDNTIKEIGITADEIKQVESSISKARETFDQLDFCLKILPDIKKEVIKMYLPILNESINKYLEALEFSGKFYFDETFEDGGGNGSKIINYKSLSMGQRQRCDLAMLFAWREVAKLLSGVETNLLVFDEVLDSSLDAEGSSLLLSLVDSIAKDTSVIIISHKDSFFDRFENQLHIGLVNGFTRLMN